MPTLRAWRPLALCLALSLPAAPAFAEVKPTPTWDATRTTAPESVTELKSLQERVKGVVDKVTPATVGLRVGMAAGSGVIVDGSGLILTAAHVIGKPNKDVTVILPDGTRVKGKTLGLNRRADSGMIKITDSPPAGAKWPGAGDGKWPYAEVSESPAVKEGQWVVTLGHPGGWKPDRRPPLRVGQVLDLYPKQRVLITNCTLVGGDSGGPLFDLNGKVVGIHSRIGPKLESNIHVPAQAFKDDWSKMAKGIIVGGSAESDAIIGVVLDQKARDAARVREVPEDSPAERAGLKAGDVILKLDGENVTSREDVDEIMQTLKPNQKVTLEVKRDDRIFELSVTLGKRPKETDPSGDNDG